MKAFLHVIPARDMANRYHGTYKDVISRVSWLKARFPDYQQALIDRDDPDQLNESLKNCTVLSGALVEYSYHPRIVKALKKRFPSAIVAVRAINNEPLQHFDNHGWWPARGPFWMMYGMARLLWMDIATKRLADQLLCINDWEIKRYWRWLPGRARCCWLPYLCPEHLLPRQPVPYAQRRIIACFPTSLKNRKSWDLVTRFMAWADQMKANGFDADFVVTGKLNDWGLPANSSVRFTGMVDDLAGFLGQCRAVCMLSPLGYGYKTTIGDAIAAGAQVIAHPALIRRSPAWVRSTLLAVNDPDLFERLEQVPDGSALPVRLQSEFDRVIAAAFAGVNQGAGVDE
ncbi:MAG: hypothetical protein ACO398_10980 [Kiritimatiellia bacterium]